MPNKYINPFTDFGFKRIFGEPLSKEMLIDFLNQLLVEEEGKITDLSYLQPEQLGGTAYDRRAVYDLYCENQKGEKFIVEMQKGRQTYFKDRSIFYSSFPIQQQAIQGKNWNFKLKAIYTVALLDFVFEDDASDLDKMLYKVKLTDIETQKVFYDKLTYVYIEMPKFNKTEEELVTRFDMWLYVLKNLPLLDHYPDKLKDRIFKRLFQRAEIAAFTSEERISYEDSMKTYRDLKNVIDTAFDEGKAEGLAEGEARGKAEEKRKMAKIMKAEGDSVSKIARLTDLSEEEVNLL